MKKIVSLLLTLSLVMIVAACGNEKAKKRDTSKETDITSRTTEIKVKDASPEELEGTPSGKLTPEIDGKSIGSVSSYDALNKKEQNKLLYNYLVRSLTSLGGDEEGAKDILKEKNYDSAEDDRLSDLFNLVKKENLNLDFNELLIEFVNKIMV